MELVEHCGQKPYIAIFRHLPGTKPAKAYGPATAQDWDQKHSVEIHPKIHSNQSHHITILQVDGVLEKVQRFS